MQPFSYTSLKVVHDSKIEEALKHQRFYAGQETRRQGVLQMCRRFLDRFINQFGRKQERLLQKL